MAMISFRISGVKYVFKNWDDPGTFSCYNKINVEPPQYFKGVRSKLFKMLKGKIA